MLATVSMNEISNTSPDPYTCENCPLSFRRPLDLRKHLRCCPSPPSAAASPIPADLNTCKELFDLLDADKDGTIVFADFVRVVGEADGLGAESCVAAALLFETMDAHKTGVVDFQAFCGSMSVDAGARLQASVAAAKESAAAAKKIADEKRQLAEEEKQNAPSTPTTPKIDACVVLNEHGLPMRARSGTASERTGRERMRRRGRRRSLSADGGRDFLKVVDKDLLQNRRTQDWTPRNISDITSFNADELEQLMLNLSEPWE
eukprot:TRINITY_DN4948_c0_g1_i1.p1 TRINITY_DN4948_c0_g1~~TRINITY_DN4948_c0_g1_i1.p1  ORF type:complete len:261 (-),score=76.85 TRINITY_DN4948_c0_g1_i1:483-1265(-)